MRILKLLLALSFLPCIAIKAQHIPDSNGVTIFVMPFDPIMYSNDIDRDISTYTKLDFEQIRDSFRIELDRTIGEYLKSKHDALAPHHLRLEDCKKDIEIMLSAISYKYEKTRSQKGAVKRKKTLIENGEIKQVDDNGAKYMSAVIKDKNKFETICKKYGVSYVVFVNQFEIKNDFTSQEAIMRGEVSRLIKVHYSLISAQGKNKGGGIAISEAPSKTLSIKNISNENFTNISYEIMNAIDGAGIKSQEKSN